MASGPGVKTAFVEAFLARDRDANEAAVNRVWREAGNAGTISGSLVSKLRQKAALTGRKRAGEKTKPRAANVTPARANGQSTSAGSSSEGRDRLLDEVEAGIDDLMFKVKAEGDMPEVEAALRRARRFLIRGHRGA
jgi:hypothetical protein